MRENSDQKNSEYRHFSRSVCLSLTYVEINAINIEEKITRNSSALFEPLKLEAVTRVCTVKNVFLKRRLQHRCFPVNFAKFLRTPFFIEAASVERKR